jgi:hypothetical protein
VDFLKSIDNDDKIKYFKDKNEQFFSAKMCQKLVEQIPLEAIKSDDLEDEKRMRMLRWMADKPD